MWQCLPIKKVIVRIAVFSFLIVLITSTTSAVSAQSNIGINSVTNVKEDRHASSVTVYTAVKAPLPRPIIQFLPGENGNTVLVADFHGVVFPFSTRVINVNNDPIAASPATVGSAARRGARGIEMVRVGRYQESPPICRVAVIASDIAKLKTVTFNSHPGSLQVRWSAVPIATHAMPPLAPSYSAANKAIPRRRAYQTAFVPPAVAPPTGEMDPDLIAIPQPSQPYPTKIDPEIAASSPSSYYPLRPPLRELDPTSAPKKNPPKALVAKAGSLAAGAPKISLKPAGDAKLDEKNRAKSTGRLKPVQTAKAEAKTAEKTWSSPGEKPTKLASAEQGKQTSNFKAEDKTAKLPPLAPKLTERPATDRVNENEADDQKIVFAEKKWDKEKALPTTEAQDKNDQKQTGLFSNLMSKVKEKTRAFLDNDDNSGEPTKETTSDKESDPQLTARENEKETPIEHGSTSQPPAVESGPPPEIFLSENSNSGYTLKIISPDKSDLNFSTFRLHNPERFVIDLDNLRAIQSAAVPQPENANLLKAIRVGTPDADKHTGRLVLDLAGETVSVIPGENESVNVVSFIVGKEGDPLVGLTPPPGSTIVIDAGHGGTDPGAQRGFLKEKDLTLSIAQKVRDLLTKEGVKVIMTRDDDTFIPLPDRVSITNNNKPDGFLSIHINSLESTSDIHGIETYYQTDMSKIFAHNIHDSLVGELKAPDRAIRRAKFYVVNRAEVPAVLAEVGFISNKSERDKLSSQDYQEKIAGALAKGAILYLKQQTAVAPKVSKTDSPEPSENASANKPGASRVPPIPHASRLAQKGLGMKSH